MARFYIDENVVLQVAFSLRRLGHDVSRPRLLQLSSAPDPAHVLAAFADGRIVISHNRRDFLLLHLAWTGWRRAWGLAPAHPGVIVTTPIKYIEAEAAVQALHEPFSQGCSPAGAIWLFDHTRQAWDTIGADSRFERRRLASPLDYAPEL